jgi:hypothetical protein
LVQGVFGVSVVDSAIPRWRILATETLFGSYEVAIRRDQVQFVARSGIGITNSDYSLSDDDPIADGIQIRILDGQTTGAVTFTIIDDTKIEGPESATLTISNPSAGIGLGATSTQDITINDDDAASQPGNVDGDSGFDANDSFLIHLVALSATDARIEQVKGSSSLTANDIRDSVALLLSAGDVDGDDDFDANDSFLIHLVKLAGSDTRRQPSVGYCGCAVCPSRTRSGFDHRRLTDVDSSELPSSAKYVSKGLETMRFPDSVKTTDALKRRVSAHRVCLPWRATKR